MYAKKILTTILRANDITMFSTMSDKADVIFTDKSDLALYRLLYDYFVKYNKIPSISYLQDFFSLEKNNQASKSFDIIQDETEISTDLLALARTQLNYVIKYKTLELQAEYETKLKLANTSDIKTLTYDYQAGVSELNQFLEEESHKRGLLYGDQAKGRFQKKYKEMKESDRGYYIGKLGFDTIDSSIGGLHNVDLINIGGFTNQGKSPFIRQTTYNLLMQGLNCMFVSLEMDYSSIETSFYTLHANNYKVFGFSNPKVTTKKVREATLSDDEEDYLFNQVIEDFNNNDSYGSLYILQPESDFSMDELFMETNRVNQTVMPLDVLVIDYAIPLIKPHKKGSQFTTEDYNAAHRRLRLHGLSFDHGRGLCTINAWQASRSGFEDALSKKNKDNLYSLMAIGQYNAIEKDSTHIFSIIQTPEMIAEGIAQIQHLKSRESKLAPLVKLQFDGSSGYLRESASQDINDDEIASVIQDIEL